MKDDLQRTLRPLSAMQQAHEGDLHPEGRDQDPARSRGPEPALHRATPKITDAPTATRKMMTATVILVIVAETTRLSMECMMEVKFTLFRVTPRGSRRST